jgi:hypothetical protein
MKTNEYPGFAATKSRLSLLTLDNPKVAKGAKKGEVTAVLHLLPAREYARITTLNGEVPGLGNLCPWAGACAASCLNTAGRGGIPMASYAGRAFANNVQHGRYRRTQLLDREPQAFRARLERDMAVVADWAASIGLSVSFRLNGTSDVHWEGIFPGLAVPSQAVRYDYTKDPRRGLAGTVDGVRYTYSLDKGAAREAIARGILAAGGNVAVVVNVRPGKPVPATFMGYPTVDGDETDLRHLDPPGHVVLLRAKGKARNDRTGFVRDAVTGAPVVAETAWELAARLCK